MFKVKLAQISMFEINYSQLIQYEILEKLVTFIRLSLLAKLFWTHCCARHVFRGSFSARHTKSVATPGLHVKYNERLIGGVYSIKD